MIKRRTRNIFRLGEESQFTYTVMHSHAFRSPSYEIQQDISVHKMLGILVKRPLAVFEDHDTVLELILQKIRLCCHFLVLI